MLSLYAVILVAVAAVVASVLCLLGTMQQAKLTTTATSACSAQVASLDKRNKLGATIPDARSLPPLPPGSFVRFFPHVYGFVCTFVYGCTF